MEGCISDWRPVTSGLLRRLVLGPLLLVIYINGLEENVQDKIYKFSVDPKIGGVVDSEVGYH